MDQHEELKKYLEIMLEIKERLKSIDELYAKKVSLGDKYRDVDFMCLQLRKILESICIGSVVMNKKKFEELQRDFISYRPPANFIDQLEKINPDFYPKPLIQGNRNSDGYLEIFDRKEGFLTKQEIVPIIKELNKFAHSLNPYDEKINYEEYLIKIPKWTKKIQMLLHYHLIRLYGSKNFYRIYLYNREDNDVHAFEHIHPDSASPNNNIHNA